jgi:hypothetical protein
MSLNLQKFLQDPENTSQDLEKIGVYFKVHPLYPNLYQFSYDQIDSSSHKSNPIVQESRGIILDSTDNWKVVAYPFNRFANYGESWAVDLSTIMENTPRMQPKLDGSLMIVYHYDNKWHVATKGSPSAGGDVGDFDFTFSSLFWLTFFKTYTLDNLNNPFTGSPVNNKGQNLTFIFELTSPYNRVVCQHYESSITLIGIRNNVTNEEFFLPNCKNIVFKTVEDYPLGTIQEVLDAVSKLCPTDVNGEGFVFVGVTKNSTILRLKVKNPSYVALHHLKEGMGKRRILDLIRLGETSEIVAYFQEFKSLFESIEAKINEEVLLAEELYATIKHIESQKEFAAEALKSNFSGALFSMRKGRAVSIRSAILAYTNENLEKILNV